MREPNNLLRIVWNYTKGDIWTHLLSYVAFVRIRQSWHTTFALGTFLVYKIFTSFWILCVFYSAGIIFIWRIISTKPLTFYLFLGSFIVYVRVYVYKGLLLWGCSLFQKNKIFHTVSLRSWYAFLVNKSKCFTRQHSQFIRSLFFFFRASTFLRIRVVFFLWNFIEWGKYLYHTSIYVR